ncbi:Coenzyme F420 hydrogenase/dehydrogenase, beta subunit C-terminal domain [Clostridium perfringens]|uniref:Coenzyme F420 hydrogenase/dehydrogenase, beta subunit C-terminal domain n=1 Tax=Clostridium perfringens TaxID=1502 RepID=UPI0022466300|nr:Coenzyme F420 hydrogenase/dehydrogenase, beta subunit C-terminal domain [Clostridium perfringens]MCX0368754.1 Coenzyme F420 hydrogenase/dehydrogenase, beta subunit C-terminal domain [Clostridium perfringens]
MNNINVKGLNECSGCTVCKLACPTNAIDMKFNTKGFFEPKVNLDKCVDCGLCKKVCYKYFDVSKYKGNNIKDTKTYAMWNTNEKIRLESSSGGVCTEIIKYAIKNEYNVIGCTYNTEKKIAEHIIIENENDIYKIIGSKYLQSNFSNILDIINLKKKYVIIGTPCQIYGIKELVKSKKKEKNFIFIDFFCHGIPSYNLWNKYINQVVKVKIEKINFREKSNGWHDFCININNGEYKKDNKEDLFFKAFLSNLCLNNSCYNCKFRFNKIYSDIRLGDFWGEEYKCDKKGVSIVVTSNDKGEEVLDSISENFLKKEEKNFNSLKKSQYHGETLYKPDKKEIFEKSLIEETILKDDIDFALKRNIFEKVFSRLRRVFR